MNIVIATLVHGFEPGHAVRTWIIDGFPQQFEEQVGKPIVVDQ